MRKYLSDLLEFLKSDDSIKEAFPALYLLANMLNPLVKSPQAKEPSLEMSSELYLLLNKIVTDFADEVFTANHNIHQEICDKYSNSKFVDGKILIAPFLSTEEYVLSLEREADDSVYRIKKIKMALKFKTMSYKMVLAHLQHEASIGRNICNELILLEPAKPSSMKGGRGNDGDGGGGDGGNSDKFLPTTLKGWLLTIMTGLALIDRIDKLDSGEDE